MVKKFFTINLLNKENYVSLSMKPQAVGEIIIINSEYVQDLNKKYF